MKTLLFAAALSLAASDPHGIDLDSIDKSVKPGDDFFKHASGGWIKANPIPDDYSRWGVWNSIEKRNFDVVKTILEESDKAGEKGTKAEQIAGAWWATGMDTKSIEAAGLKPLEADLAAIDAVKDVPGLVDLFAHLHRIGISSVFNFGSTQDYKDSSQVIGGASQGGLGLPDRDYYTRDDEKSKKIREQYVEYVGSLLELLGADKAGAAKIMELETRLAKASLTSVERRDPVKTYHKLSAEDLAKLTPKLDWKRYMKQAGKEDVPFVNVESPSYMQEAEKALNEVPLDTWKIYAKFHLLDSAAPYLHDKAVEAQFAFRGKILTGRKQLLPRFKRVINAANLAIGEAIGEAYVKRMFPPAAKEKALAMVNDMKTTLGEMLSTVEWMTPETRKKAVGKLQSFRPKIGYPDKFRDYTKLTVARDSWWANVLRAREFEFQRDLDKIGKPVDRNEWYMPPQMINAYYDPSMNEIVFPAAILQPPLFDPEAEDAKNLGGIGAIIGHEMGHGFDDQGAKFDEKGNMSDWWTADDVKKFEERTKCISTQFAKYGIEGGIMTKGDLVTGEACGDLTGMVIAYRTLKKKVGEKGAEKDANGHNVYQRLFYAFAQGWAGHARPEQERVMIQTDPHPLVQFRVNGTVTNMPEFFEAFDIKEGALKPKEGCKLW